MLGRAFNDRNSQRCNYSVIILYDLYGIFTNTAKVVYKLIRVMFKQKNNLGCCKVTYLIQLNK